MIHSLETGTTRVISANVVNDGLITNLPDGVAVEVPTLLDALGAHPMKVGDLPPQCAALNRGFLGPVDLAVRAAVDGRSAAGARGGHGRPEHRGDADRRPDLGTVRRADRRAR